MNGLHIDGWPYSVYKNGNSKKKQQVFGQYPNVKKDDVLTRPSKWQQIQHGAIILRQERERGISWQLENQCTGSACCDNKIGIQPILAMAREYI